MLPDLKKDKKEQIIIYIHLNYLTIIDYQPYVNKL